MSNQPKTVDLKLLPPQQILELRNSTEREVEHFTQSLQALQTAQAKLKECLGSVDSMGKSESDDLLVPLSSSLYLPGKIVNKDEYLVDIGTGYFVGKLGKEAKAVYESKIEKLNEDSNKLREILVQKNEIINSMNIVLRSKMAESQGEQSAT
ncbi:subunit of tubulin prefoldin [Scheffersomyces spartinae]|uniref:Subunit of tubulin prefoldin n=1 Tax=Scheffersomyces spartinae TaxID=45513 RepID=A0A9P8AGQ5_9ASCO|nr:subunit of tubulin prefoldin [Scheffersomyces spartinae]KAG7192595.1 subunit of tubulin prefoldin [Scheffersomyces spartinae]